MPHEDHVASSSLANEPVTDAAQVPADQTLLSRRTELTRCLDEAAHLGVDPDACGVLRQKLRDMTFNLVVAGQFKRGKSSILNALLGEALLPVGVIPVTSIITVIRAGSAKVACAELQDGREERISTDALSSYVTERGNPHNVLGVRQVTIEHPSAWLANGVRLIDTPGIGSVYEHNTDVAQQYLPNADAVLFIASVDQPLARAELDFLLSIRQYADKIFCVLNKIDHLSAEELSDSIAFVRDQLGASLGVAVPLFPVSARLALQAKREADIAALHRSGFPQFEESLRKFMSEDKESALVASICRSLLRLSSQARFTHELEAKVLIAPQEQLDSNLAAFNRKRSEIHRTSADHQVLLQSDAKALFDNQVCSELETFKRSEQSRIGSRVSGWYDELASFPLRKLQPALEQRISTEIRSSFDAWLASEDSVLTDAFSSLCERAWTSLQSAVDELIRYSSALFAVSFEPVAAESHWSMESRFYYKFWSEPTSLRLIARSLVLLLPKWLARRRLIRHATAHATELIEMQAGRIRYDLQQRLHASVLDVNRRINLAAESILAHIDIAIQDGLRMRQLSTAQVDTRGRELRAALESLAALERRIRTVCA